jgi:hypothetical protein
MAPSGRGLREAVEEPAGFPETSEREFWGFQPTGEKRPIEDIYRTVLMRRATLYNSIHRVLLPSFCFAKIHLPPGGRQ